ncbi:MAG: formate/nitrite transporter family protein [Balneolaceae bacterium]|nr:formate/nitrite transporter family protein [Balneolaceae bacterium]
MGLSEENGDTQKTGIDLDAYDPNQVAKRVMKIGVKKTRYPAYKTMVLGLMGGCFISFGALYEIYIMAHPDIGLGTATILGPLFYAVGYIMAFIAGAEIFTTNNLSAMGLASGKLSFWDVSKNWTIVLFANFIGALFIVTLFYFQGWLTSMMVL